MCLDEEKGNYPEDHYVEMREGIACEMVQNEELYLDKYLERGMNPNGNVDVAKPIAAYSSLYIGTQPNKKKKHQRTV